MTESRTPHAWSKDSLLSKAQRYAEIMLTHDRSDWQFGLWSAFVLELLLRATVSNISPALLADRQNWDNILYAIGHEPVGEKFTPKSVGIAEIANRAEALIPCFTREMLSFSLTHLNRRNTEVHSGELAFDGLGTSTWVPRFYETCHALLNELGESLESLVGEEESQQAVKEIEALKDKAAKSVQKNINAHKMVWEGKRTEERTKLAKQAETLSTRNLGHRVTCPACGCTALLQGSPTGSPKQSIEDGLIVERQSRLPSSFECRACELKISGYSRLAGCGLGDAYTSTIHYDPVEFFNIDIEEEYQGMMYEDNNEYGLM